MMFDAAYSAVTDRVSPLAADLEGVLHQLDVGGAVQLVAPVGGDVEVDEVARLQRVVTLLVLVAVRYLNRTEEFKHTLVD